MDWRVAFGLTITVVWISTGLFYLMSVVGLNSFVSLPTADIGSFLNMKSDGFPVTGKVL